MLLMYRLYIWYWYITIRENKFSHFQGFSPHDGFVALNQLLFCNKILISVFVLYLLFVWSIIYMNIIHYTWLSYTWYKMIPITDYLSRNVNIDTLINTFDILYICISYHTVTTHIDYTYYTYKHTNNIKIK